MVLAARNARFQQWTSLLHTRAKRARHGAFIVQGVQPITAVVGAGWDVTTLLVGPPPRSGWATELIGRAGAEVVELAPELLDELGGRSDGPPEMVAVVATPPDDLDRLGPDVTLVVIADRPGNPGNLGTLIRSADALGADGLVVTGHACDLYDPVTVRASRGSLFAVPCVRAAGPDQVVDWLAGRTRPPTVVGTAEDASVELWACDLTAPVAVVVGNETTGMSRTWVERCATVVGIPMVGRASSLNAAVSGSVVLYEVARQRAAAGVATRE